MALTRAQLLAGNQNQGVVLSGEVQGITAGNGLTINTDGSITINSQTVIGVMKLGQTPATAAAAYNLYTWPTSTGSIGQQLTILGTGATTTLAWSDPDQIPWTAKGQLVVGTGAGTQTLLNVGANGQVLIADSAATSGLSYTSNFVSGITAGSNIAISGTTGNVTINAIPGGAIGTITGVTAGTGLSGGGTSGVITLTNAGVTSLIAGSNITLSSATGDITINATGGGGGSGTVTSVTAGTGLGAPATGASITTSGTIDLLPPTGATIGGVKAGTNIAIAGDGTISVTAGGAVGTVTSVDVSGGTTGLSFGGGPITASGVLTMNGTLVLGNGGTGASTQAGAANNILPAQGAGNAGKFLTTDGSNVSWSAASVEIPSGTAIVFAQAAAPTGWTQVTSAAYNDSAIRLVTTAGGGTGGATPFSTLFNSTATYTGTVTITSGQVGNTTLTVNQIPSHDHDTNFPWLSGSGGPIGTKYQPGGAGGSNTTMNATGGGQSHTHTLIGVVAGGNFTSDFGVKYVDMIVCTKN